MDKDKFALSVIGILAVLQGAAWFMGFNGQVFAFTSLIVGTIAGSVLGFSFGYKKNSK